MSTVAAGEIKRLHCRNRLFWNHGPIRVVIPILPGADFIGGDWRLISHELHFHADSGRSKQMKRRSVLIVALKAVVIYGLPQQAASRVC
jgi:hypothetical protein